MTARPGSRRRRFTPGIRRTDLRPITWRGLRHSLGLLRLWGNSGVELVVKGVLMAAGQRVYSWPVRDRKKCEGGSIVTADDHSGGPVE